MSFDDFVSNFQRLEICYLGPDTLAVANDDEEEDPDKHKWEGNLFEGGWKRRVNAGGCRNHRMLFCYSAIFFAIMSEIVDYYRPRQYGR